MSNQITTEFLPGDRVYFTGMPNKDVNHYIIHSAVIDSLLVEKRKHTKQQVQYCMDGVTLDEQYIYKTLQEAEAAAIAQLAAHHLKSKTNEDFDDDSDDDDEGRYLLPNKKAKKKHKK